MLIHKQTIKKLQNKYKARLKRLKASRKKNLWDFGPFSISALISQLVNVGHVRKNNSGPCPNLTLLTFSGVHA